MRAKPLPLIPPVQKLFRNHVSPPELVNLGQVMLPFTEYTCRPFIDPFNDFYIIKINDKKTLQDIENMKPLSCNDAGNQNTKKIN